VARVFPFQGFGEFPDLTGHHSRKTFTGGLSRRTKAKGICGQLVCLTGGSVPVTMITRKLFAQLTLGEISSPLGSPDTFHEIYEHSRNTNTRTPINAIAFFSAAEKNVATGEFKNCFFFVSGSERKMS